MTINQKYLKGNQLNGLLESGTYTFHRQINLASYSEGHQAMQEWWWDIDRHRLTAADLEDSIQALLGENEEEAVQRFLDHTGKISEGIIRLGPISLWIVISFFCSLTISHKCEEKTITVQKRYEHHYHHLACWSLMWDGVFNFHNHLPHQKSLTI